MTKPSHETLEAYRRDVAVWDGWGEHFVDSCAPNYRSDANALRPCLMKLTDKEWLAFTDNIEKVTGIANMWDLKINLLCHLLFTLEPWMPFVALWKTVCEGKKK